MTCLVPRAMKYGPFLSQRGRQKNISKLVSLGTLELHRKVVASQTVWPPKKPACYWKLVRQASVKNHSHMKLGRSSLEQVICRLCLMIWLHNQKQSNHSYSKEVCKTVMYNFQIKKTLIEAVKNKMEALTPSSKQQRRINDWTASSPLMNPVT